MKKSLKIKLIPGIIILKLGIKIHKSQIYPIYISIMLQK